MRIEILSSCLLFCVLLNGVHSVVSQNFTSFGSGNILSRTRRQGLNWDRYPSSWIDRRLPYQIDSNFTKDDRENFEDAINKFNEIDNFQVAPYNGEKDYVVVTNGKGCHSNLGKVGGPQEISLQRNRCLDKGIVLHMFLNAAGIIDEHRRPDRDDYIEMQWENIPDEYKAQYEKFSGHDVVILGPYDYYSITHAAVLAPGTNKAAFRVKQQSIDIRRIGNGDHLTNTDIDKINKFYN